MGVGVNAIHPHPIPTSSAHLWSLTHMPCNTSRNTHHTHTHTVTHTQTAHTDAAYTHTHTHTQHTHTYSVHRYRTQGAHSYERCVHHVAPPSNPLLVQTFPPPPPPPSPQTLTTFTPLVAGYPMKMTPRRCLELLLCVEQILGGRCHRLKPLLRSEIGRSLSE